MGERRRGKEWSVEEIVADLRRRVKKGEDIPEPSSLKFSYGPPFGLNSQFFPLLVQIQETYPDLHEVIEKLWAKSDPRDLRFRSGKCTCPMCHD